MPWWWRPPGHGGSNLAIRALVALAAAQSVPFLWRRRLPPLVLAATAAALAVKFALHLNLWSASAAVLTAAYGLGAYGSRTLRAEPSGPWWRWPRPRGARHPAGHHENNHTTAIGCALFATALAVGEITARAPGPRHEPGQAGLRAGAGVLAREVHDVVAHQLSAFAVQAGAARFASTDDPQAGGSP